MFEDVFLEYLVLIGAVLIGISVTADFLPSDVGAPLSKFAIRAFIAVVLIALVLEAPRYLGNPTQKAPGAAKRMTP